MSSNCHWKSGRHINFQRTTSFTDGATKKIFMTKVSFILERTLYTSLSLSLKNFKGGLEFVCANNNNNSKNFVSKLRRDLGRHEKLLEHSRTALTALAAILPHTGDPLAHFWSRTHVAYLLASIKYSRFRKKYNSILCVTEKELNFSRRV